MPRFLPVLALGFFLGMRHATDADHVVAVATFVSRERRVRVASLLGGLWGVGHTLTILAVGGAIIGFGLVLPPRLGLSMELSVALMLVVLGSINLLGVSPISEIRHGHAAHDSSSPRENLFSSVPRAQAARSFTVGVVHGLAGSAAVALMVLATIRDPSWALLYLVLFGAGTIAGMMLITSAMAVPIALAAARAERFGRSLAWISGLLSVGFGLFLVYQIGFVDGLFTSHPAWQPR